MRCYHCAKYDFHPERMQYQVSEAIGVCRQCGEAVCEAHAVKSDMPLPGAGEGAATGQRALMPLLCRDCYEAIRAPAVR